MSIRSRPSRLQCGIQLSLAFMRKNNEGANENTVQYIKEYITFTRLYENKFYVYNYIFIDMVMNVCCNDQYFVYIMQT